MKPFFRNPTKSISLSARFLNAKASAERPATNAFTFRSRERPYTRNHLSNIYVTYTLHIRNHLGNHINRAHGVRETQYSRRRSARRRHPTCIQPRSIISRCTAALHHWSPDQRPDVPAAAAASTKTTEIAVLLIAILVYSRFP